MTALLITAMKDCTLRDWMKCDSQYLVSFTVSTVEDGSRLGNAEP